MKNIIKKAFTSKKKCSIIIKTFVLQNGGTIAMSEKTVNEKSKLHEGHRDRMRKRFRETGFDGFTDHEVIEMLLFYACPRRDTNEIAHLLINKFGGIAGIIEADYEELVTVKYITDSAATLLKMIPKLMPIYSNSKSSSTEYNNTDKLKALFEPYFVGLTHEEFRIACFDNNLKLLKNVAVSNGDPTGAPVDIRRLVEIALREKATSIAIAHNHPKSSPKPSNQDILTTQTIIEVMQNIRIGFLDHIIIGENETLAMKESAYTKFLG